MISHIAQQIFGGQPVEPEGIMSDLPAIGRPVLCHPDSSPLAFEEDPPHIRLFAWALLNVSLSVPGQIDITKAAKDCRLSREGVRDALVRLVQDGDLVRSTERSRELFRLNIQYHTDGDQP